MRKLFRLIVAAIVVMSVLAPSGSVGQDGRGQGGRGQGGGLGRGSQPVAYDDYTGYVKLWDGETFNGWEGETDVWSIEHGVIHAETTKTPGQHHIHYVGPGAIMKDFDLKVEFRISEMGANGGIQYRSRLLHPAHGGSIEDPLGKPLPAGITTVAKAVAAGITAAPAGGGNAPNPWQVSGYQFDLDSGNRYTGQLYEGQGRGIVNPPGGVVQLLPDGRNIRIGTAAENPGQFVKPHKGLAGEWQQVQVVARGNTLVHMINGQVITVSIDDNPAMRAYQGILSLQLEGSGQIWYRNVYVKQLEK